MNIFRTIVMLCLIIPSICSAYGKGKYERSKTIRKTFDVVDNNQLNVINKYGNVEIVTWDNDTVDFTVKISVSGDDVALINKKLKAITVNFNQRGKSVSAETIIEKVSTGWTWWKNNSLNFKINYIVKVPKYNSIDIKNKYGNIFVVGDRFGESVIKCKYGKIDVDRLLHASNTIDLAYSSGSEIEEIKSGEIEADYSSLFIDNSEEIILNTDYTSVKVKKVNHLEFEMDYGALKVGQVQKIIGESDYTAIKIDKAIKRVDIETDYGSVKIKELVKGFESVRIDAKYAACKIGFLEDNNFNFKVKLAYAGFRYPNDKLTLYKKIKKSFSKYYEGYFGKEGSKSIVILNSDYGGVSFNVK